MLWVEQLDRTQRGGGREKGVWKWGSFRGTWRWGAPLSEALTVMKGRLWERPSLLMGAQLGHLE